MFWNKCNHPFDRLAVQKDSTVVDDPKYPGDYNLVTHHLFCRKCGEKLDIKYAQMVGGYDAWMERGMSTARAEASAKTPYTIAADQADAEWQLVPTRFNGIDGNKIYANSVGDIKFVNPKGKIDYQTIESVTVRMTQSDIQASPELSQTCDDAIRFAIKLKNGEI